MYDNVRLLPRQKWVQPAGPVYMDLHNIIDLSTKDDFCCSSKFKGDNLSTKRKTPAKLAPPTSHGDCSKLENFSALSLLTSTAAVTSVECMLSPSARRWNRAMFPQPMKAKRTAAIVSDVLSKQINHYQDVSIIIMTFVPIVNTTLSCH